MAMFSLKLDSERQVQIVLSGLDALHASLRRRYNAESNAEIKAILGRQLADVDAVRSLTLSLTGA